MDATIGSIFNEHKWRSTVSIYCEFKYLLHTVYSDEGLLHFETIHMCQHWLEGAREWMDNRKVTAVCDNSCGNWGRDASLLAWWQWTKSLY